MPLSRSNLPSYRTERLILRPWKEEDFDFFAQLKSDHEVMRYFPKLLGRQESNEVAHKIINSMNQNKFGIWMVEETNHHERVGIVGLQRVNFAAHFTPAVEVGWKLARQHWGKGYATEAARKSLELGFTDFGLEEIVALTIPENQASRKVMERLGMTYNPDEDFEHPKIEPGSRCSKHVIYRIKKDNFAF
ncbi:MAG: GNAT family N-acetyltransferase [Bdellovibrionales bacterium]|nr:GNAT family N-acetyltransferase [Bdellovibrionales bacterium]